MSAMTTPTTHTARRKEGRCTICDLPILLGQKYQKWRWFGDGGPTTCTVHPDCWDLMNDHDIHEWFVGDTFWECLQEMTREEAIKAAEDCHDPVVGSVWLANLEEVWADEDFGEDDG